MRKVTLLVLIAVSSFGFCFADGWTGMWRVQRYHEGKLDGTCHVYISDAAEDRVTAYSDDARPYIIQSVTLQGDQLDLQVANSAKQLLPLAFSLKRVKDHLSGEWLFSQMQLAEPIKGEAVGHKILDSPDWRPWDEVEKARESRTLNILEEVRKNAPRNTLSQFTKYFKREIEPKYYFLLQSWLYGERGDPDMSRFKYLSMLFEDLVEGGGSWSAPDRFGKLAPDALALLRTRQGDMVPVYFVSYPGPAAVATTALWTKVPTPEEEEDCACKLDLRERFVLVNPSLFPEGGPGDVQLAMQITYQALWALPAPNLALEVFRRALTFRSALRATGTPAQPLDPALVGIIKDSFLPRLMEPSTPGFPRSDGEQALAESLGFTVGSDFLNWFEQQHPEMAPVKVDEIKVMVAWVQYLTGKEPDSKKTKKGKRS